MPEKINILVIPSDHYGCGKFRSVGPHTYISEHFSDEFNVDIVYPNDLPKSNLEEFFKKYQIVHIHKQLDKDCKIASMIKFLGIKLVVDVDDYYLLGDHHPMSLSAKKEKWHIPIVNHLRIADAVTTTTKIYAKELKKHNKNVYVFPNAIDPDEEQFKQVKEENPSGRLRVGLICGSSHLDDIKLLENLPKQIPLDKVQIVLCGFDTNGTRTIYNSQTGEVTRRPIKPEESVWYEYEKILTNNYNIVSKEHKDFLLKFLKSVDDPYTNEPYRRMWTRDINHYATHYQAVDVLLAPLLECDFNKMKSELKETECGFTDTAFVAQNFGAYTINLVPYFEKGGKVNENGTALLVDSSKNHKLWGKYITKLAENPEIVKKLKENLSKFVHENYTMEKICQRRVEFYKKLVGEE